MCKFSLNIYHLKLATCVYLMPACCFFADHLYELHSSEGDNTVLKYQGMLWELTREMARSRKHCRQMWRIFTLLMGPTSGSQGCCGISVLQKK